MELNREQLRGLRTRYWEAWAQYTTHLGGQKRETSSQLGLTLTAARLHDMVPDKKKQLEAEADAASERNSEHAQAATKAINNMIELAQEIKLPVSFETDQWLRTRDGFPMLAKMVKEELDHLDFALVATEAMSATRDAASAAKSSARTALLSVVIAALTLGIAGVSVYLSMHRG